tara:strand:- start:898 stop:1557 length:660 start_codon:yes stop_codon:yes gene_type:complete
MFSDIYIFNFINFIDLDLITRIILALLFGFILGIEREYRAKPAGIKTYALICLGSTIITYISMSFEKPADPSRMAAQIVSGLGFIGAGTIFQSKRIITGLTTASSLWVVGAIGIMIGVGKIVESAIVLILIYSYFYISRFLVSKKMRRYKYSTLITMKKGESTTLLDELIKFYKIDIQSRSINKSKSLDIQIVYLAKKSQNDKFTKQLIEADFIKKIEH